MKERNNLVKFNGQPLTLLGPELKEGDPAPEFVALNGDLEPVKLSDLDADVLVLCSVPSLDTPVCDAEARRFNEEASKLGDNVKIVTISMDLPFAQARWCAAKGIDQVQTLSDHRDAAFGMAYGMLIKELRLLGRAVFVLDSDRRIRYIQLVQEVTNEPDYDSVLDAVKKIAG